MIQEEKQLLLQDLCARLPYGVIVNTPKGDGHLGDIKLTIFGNEYGVNIKATERDYFNDSECELRPYLRSMSSMTVEEEKEYESFIFTLHHEWDGHSTYTRYIEAENAHYYTYWLNTHHFDVYGLIPKGLALEAEEGMYR